MPSSTPHLYTLALHDALPILESFGSFVAEVAEVSVSRSSGEVRVHRVVCAVDCGRHVNPDTVAAQMEGGIVYGLAAALKGQITIDRKSTRLNSSHRCISYAVFDSPSLHSCPTRRSSDLGVVWKFCCRSCGSQCEPQLRRSARASRCLCCGLRPPCQPRHGCGSDGRRDCLRLGRRA